MKITPAVAWLLACLTAAILSLYPAVLAAQDPRELMPAASEAKARELLDQAITALGGPAYLNARDMDCKGTFSQFESSGAIGGTVQTHILKQFPDKYRVELESKTFITEIYGIPVNKKGNHVIDVYSGDHGWMLNTGQGISELDPEALADYQDQLKTDINVILRSRLHEDGMTLRYGGSDIVDVRQVDWVELTDRDRRLIRMTVDKKTHLPARVSVTTRDPQTGERKETAHVYSNYQMIDGIVTPMQSSVFVNDRQVSQLFYTSCHNNTGLSPDLFTEAGLKAQYSGKKIN
jgi:hypothetical protein